MSNTVNMQVKVAPDVVKDIDQLVRKGVYMNRSDFLRIAARQLLDENKGKL